MYAAYDKSLLCMVILCMRGAIGSTLCFSKPNMANDNQAEISSSICVVFKDFVVLEFNLHTEAVTKTGNHYIIETRN